MVSVQGPIFKNFKSPFVNLEWVKLETSNLVHELILASPISRMTKYPQTGRGQVQGLNF